MYKCTILLAYDYTDIINFLFNKGGSCRFIRHGLIIPAQRKQTLHDY